MNSGFWSAITGVKAQQSAIDTAANNIANINTTGYRGSTIEFATLFSSLVGQSSVTSDNGYGARVGATAIDTRSGSYQQTDSVFDFAIADDGWFGVTASNIMDASTVAYTRNGAFSRDQNGMLVTQNGNYVLGTSYGNMAYENGAWRILPDVSTGGLSGIDAQTSIFIPENIYYPPIATKTASLTTNLTNAVKDAPALLDSLLTSLNAGAKEGDKLLLASGEEAAALNDDGGITLQKTVHDTLMPPLNFSINGTAVNADWTAGASAEEIAAAISNAINQSGAAQAVSSGAVVEISSADRLQIGTDGQTFFLPLNAEIVTVASDSTVQTLRSALEENALALYQDAAVTYRYDGVFELNSAGGASVKIESDNAVLQEMFASFDGASRNKASSSAFYETAETASQTAIAPNGDRLKLESVTRGYDDPLTSVRLKRLEDASNANLLSQVTVNGKELDLLGGENLLFAFGKTPASTSTGYGYPLTVEADAADGVPPTVSFTLNGREYSWTGTDGADANSIASAIKGMLDADGVLTHKSGSSLIIYPQNGVLSLLNGSTNIGAMEIEPLSLTLIAYEKDETIGSFLSKIDAAASSMNAHIYMEDSVINLSLQGGSAINVNVYSGGNTPSDLYALFSPLNSILTDTQSLNALSAYSIVSQADNIAPNGSATLDNEGEPLLFSVSVTKEAAFGQSASIGADGAARGEFEGYTAGDHGEIIATFTNGRQSQIAQLAVYQFANDQGLMRIGDSLFMGSANSGAPFFYLDEDGNLMNTVVGKTLENSNVQAAQALTDLIIFQRAFEGSAKAITTNDQLIQGAINMKR
ncbi:MAG: flagellar hook-basal body complex protein [Helicobacteraceae bacterium]|jgi:flagellar hook-basal body protein|nr:flagellar hook-basal body complex protein [Helicobacteraceae bacterium]